MSDELREKVARAICQEQCAFYGEPSCWDVAGGPSPQCDEPGCQAFADAAIALIWNEAMEEAARVADTLEDALSVEWRKGLKCDSHLEGRSDGAGEVAAAIRARKKP